MDFYVNEFMEHNNIVIDKPFKVENVSRPLVVNHDGTMLYQDTDEVVPIGIVFSILSGAYKVLPDTDDTVFKNDEVYYYVDECGTVLVETWCGDVADYSLLYMGNAFKTRKEAEDNIDYVLDVFENVNKKTSILPSSKGGSVKEDTGDTKQAKAQSFINLNTGKVAKQKQPDTNQSATMSLEKDTGGNYSGYVSYINNGKLVTKELDNYKSLSDILKQAFTDMYGK